MVYFFECVLRVYKPGIPGIPRLAPARGADHDESPVKVRSPTFDSKQTSSQIHAVVLSLSRSRGQQHHCCALLSVHALSTQRMRVQCQQGLARELPSCMRLLATGVLCSAHTESAATKTKANDCCRVVVGVH